jgi:dinuclear metal center YbgI/SA1388 family protein
LELKIRDIVAAIEELAPLSYQESYDNAGLIVGQPDEDVKGVLVCLDVVEEVVEEAKSKGVNLIIAHHPIVFKGLKRFNGNNYVERTVMAAIREGIAIYAAHTNLDAVIGGVNTRICDKLKLVNQKVLAPVGGDLKKLVTFVPTDHADRVRTAIFQAGAGCIGNYDSCSFNLEGKGSFRGGDNTRPFVGEKGKIHFEPELRVETIFPKHLQGKVLKALLAAHPYEEVAYDIYSLDNLNPQVGIGMVGELEEPVDTLIFLKQVKEIFGAGVVRYTSLVKPRVSRVAVCGGSGSFLLKNAIAAQADVFITGDFKYHEFFDAEQRIVIADIGHFESEQFTKEIFYEIVTKKFPNFAVLMSEINSNPINYL